MMKKAVRTMVCGAMMMASMLTMTSCLSMIEWILGEDDNPTEVLTNLGAALEEGALITIDYTIDGVKYTSTFKKVGDEYVKQSTTPAAARALTRGVEEPYDVELTDLGALSEDDGEDDHKLVLKMNLEVLMDDEVKLDATVDGENNKLTTNFATEGSAVQGMQVNGQEARLVNTDKEYAGVELDNTETDGDKKLGGIPFSEGESWIDMAGKQENNGGQYLQMDEDGNKVYFSANGYTGYLVDINKTPVKPRDKVGKKTFYLKLSGDIAYKEKSWDAINHQIVETNKTVGSYHLVTNSKSKVTWNKKAYLVNKDVTIKGRIQCKKDIKLFLRDGCTLTVEGSIQGGKKSLTIFGQSSGILYLKNANLEKFSHVVIHGGAVKTTGNGTNQNFNLTMYGGKFSAKKSGNSVITGESRDMTIYDGEVEVTSTQGNAIIVGSDDKPGTLTVYGGRVRAGALKGRAFKGKLAAGNGCNISYREGYVNNEGITIWGDYVPVTTTITPNDNYFQVIPTSEVTNN